MRAPVALALLLAGCPWVGPGALDDRLDLDGDGYLAGADCDETDADWPKIYYADADLDGFGDSGAAGDPVCDDPGAGWSLDATDCDDADGDVHVASTWFLDRDGDGYGWDDPGDSSDDPVEACGAPTDHVGNGNDCVDTDATVHPDATELCDGIINLCGVVTLPTDESDVDGDGYVVCTVDVGGWDGGVSKQGGDCNDADDTIFPSAPELCDGLVNTCGGTLPDDETDDDVGGGDGYVECTIDDEWRGVVTVVGGDDCDDDDSSVYLGADEVCGDGVANDCAGYDGSCDLPSMLIVDDAAITIDGGGTNVPFERVRFYRDGGSSSALAIGAPDALSGKGEVFVFGSPVALGAAASDAADTVLVGDTGALAGTFLGASPAFSTLAVTEPGLVPTSGQFGACHVLSSATIADGNTLPPTGPSAALGGWAGWSGTNAFVTPSVASPITGSALGDFDGDGAADVLTGSTLVYGALSGTMDLDVTGDTNAGKTIPGLTIDDTSDDLGRYVLLADAVGSAQDEILLGGTDAGRALILPGPPSPAPGSRLVGTIPADDVGSPMPGASFTGTAADHFGYAIWPMGDFDGDGTQDVVVTAPEASSAGGKAYLVFGPLPPGDYAEANLGVRDGGGAWTGTHAIVFTGGPGDQVGLLEGGFPQLLDINGDDLDDLVLPAPGFQGGHGAVFVVFGTATPEALCQGPSGVCTAGVQRVANGQVDEIPGVHIDGPPGSRLGIDVDAGDVDGDGLRDLAVLADGLGSGGDGHARVFVFLLGAEGM